MIATRFAALLLLAALANAQNISAPESAPSPVAEPELPVIDHNVCPFEGCVFRQWTVIKPATLCNSWRDERKAIGELKEGEKVQGVTGTYVIHKPDRFLVKKPIPLFSLNPGDVILQYQEWGEGSADLWAKGRWHRDFDWGETQDGDPVLTQDGFTLPPVFPEGSVELVEQGVKEWWVRVTRADQTTGWVLEQGNFSNMDRLGGSPEKQAGAKPSPATAGPPEPKLPVIDHKACPGEGQTVPDWKIANSDRMYSSFQDGHSLIGTLNAREKVTVLAGVNVIREPDRAVIKHDQDDPPLLRGDIALRYGFHSDGNSDFWSKGVWFAEYYEEIVEKGGECGFADKSNCTIAIVRNGVNEWWVQVKAGTRTGWVLAHKRTGDKRWDDGNFGELCRMD
jgi:hypothetical protein